MKTLIINTYAGSLLLGADAVLGAEIVGSYEDSGFGASITRANRDKFRSLAPSFHFVDHRRDWPDQDLSSTVVLAHPPCAAFSQQNNSTAKRGTNTEAFDCTRVVLRYAMGCNAAGIAVESVMGALGGAWDVHEHFAEVGGYHVYRVVKNSLLFGVPQWRERFWVVFVRKGLADETMTWRLHPQVTNVDYTVNPVLPGNEAFRAWRSIDKYLDQLSVGPCICGQVHGFDRGELYRVGLDPQLTTRRKSFSRLIQPAFFPGLSHATVGRKHVSAFASAQPSILAPGGYAPVLLGSSNWVYRGVPLCEEGYKVIMGFPADYVFPEEGRCRQSFKTYLSKGVCPPVATWILANVFDHLEGHKQRNVLNAWPTYSKTCAPGHVVSFRPGKVAVLQRLEEMFEHGVVVSEEPIVLRDEEEALEAD